MSQAHYPNIHIRLRSRNPFALVAAVRQELRRAGVDQSQIERFSQEALSCKNRHELRAICGRWVEVEGPPDPGSLV